MAATVLYTNIANIPTGITTLVSDEISLKGFTAADTWDVFKIPKGSMVLGALVEVTETSGETCTIDVGITGTDVDEWVDGADIEQAAGGVVSVQGDGITTVTLTTAATVVTALAVAGTTYAAGKFRVHLLVAKL